MPKTDPGLFAQELLLLAKSPHLVSGNLSEMLREITETAARVLAVERVGVWVLRPTRTSMECVNLFEKSPKRHSSGLELAAENYPAYFRAMDEDRTIAAHEARTDPRTHEFAESYLEPLGITSMLDAPIRVAGAMTGVVCHEHVGEARTWSAEEMTFGASIADFAALSFEAHDRMQAEKALREEIKARAEKERLAALGEMAAVVAHEVRNPVGAIYNALSCLRRVIEPTDEAEHLLQIVHEEAGRISNLSQDLLDVARPVHATIEQVEPEAIIRSAMAVAFTNPAFAERDVTLVEAIDTLPAMSCDPRLVHQIMVNLIANAGESALAGTSVKVGARVLEDEGFFEFDVCNDSEPLSADVLERMFDPFFTTKSVGSGLGLAIVRRLVAVLRGDVTLNQTDAVVTALVRLPIDLGSAGG